MKMFIKGLGRGEKGFTLIELLIVIAILGIIAAVVVPNVGGFMTSGTLNAANTELENVRVAGLGYYAEHNAWPASTADATGGPIAPYISGSLKAVYAWSSSGLITGSALTGGWAASSGILPIATGNGFLNLLNQG